MTALRLLLRQARSEVATLVALALTTVLVAAVLTAWPRAVDRMVAEDLAQQVAAVPAVGRDLTLPQQPRVPLDVVATPAEAQAVLDQTAQQARDRVADAGPALTALLGEPEYVVERPTAEITRGDSTDVAHMSLTLLVDPGLPDRVELAEGALPAAYDAGAAAGRPLGAATGPGPLPTVEVVLSTETAAGLRWAVGEERESPDLGFPATLRLSGTFEARDAGAGFWRHLPSTLAPSVVDDPNAGVLVTGVAFVDPGALAAITVPTGATTSFWYPLDAARVTDVDRETLIADLLGIRAAEGLRSETTDTLVAGRQREATVTTLLDVVAVGVSGTALGVLWLAAALAVDRRRAAFVLLRARGASGAAVRGLAAAQGLAVAVPAGLLGVAAGLLLVPGAVRAQDLVAPVAATLAPAVLLGVAAGGALGRTARADVGATRSRWRWVAEALVVVVAAAALVAVAQHGTAGVTGGDPLVSALPVVLGLAAAVLVLRLYPWPVRGLLALVRRRRGAGAFLGAAQAGRAPAAGIVPVVALVLGVVTVGLSAVTLSTVAAGTQRGAVLATGADARIDLRVSTVSGTGLTAAQVDAARAVDGVAAVATVGDAGRRVLEVGRTTDTVPVVVVDAADLADVQGGRPELPALPAALAGGPSGADDALPAVVASGADRDLDQPVTLRVGMTRAAVPLTPVGEVRDVPGVASGKTWVLVDRAAWEARTGVAPTVDRMLVRVVPGADPESVAAEIATMLDTPVSVATVAGAREQVDRAVLVRGTRTALLVVTGLSALLCAGVLGLLLLTGAPARGRTTALLRTLGAPSGVRRWLVAAEVVGPVVVSLAGGLLVGAVLPGLVLGVADLRLFTGSAERVEPVLDVGTVAAVAGAGIVVCALALVLAVVAARRVDAVEVLREGA